MGSATLVDTTWTIGLPRLRLPVPNRSAGGRNRVNQPQILEQRLHLAGVIHVGAALAVAVATSTLAAFAGFRRRAGTVAALGGVAVAVVSMTVASVGG